MSKAIFVEKDGTLLYDIPYNVDPALIRWQPGVIEALKRFRERNYLLIVTSNQSGIAHGYFGVDALQTVQEKMQHDLRRSNVRLDGFYFCPHHPNGTVREYAVPCTCRKPEPGLILKAAADFDIELSSSWVIGDILNDIEAGNKAGCRSIMIDNGNETEWKMSLPRHPWGMAFSLSEAAEKIFQSELYASKQ